MNQNLINEKIKKIFNSGLNFLNDGNYRKALKEFLKAYKLSIKANNSQYLYESSSQINNTAYSLAVEIYNEGVHLYESSQYAKVYDKVNAAIKVANVGIQYACPFHDEQKYNELLEYIKQLETYNHQAIEYIISQKPVEDNQNIDNYQYEFDDKEDEDLEPEEEMDDIERGYLNQAKELYEKADSYADDKMAIDYFYRCYKIAHKHKFDELKHDACECIARRYYSIGTDLYNKAVEHYNYGSYSDAMYTFNDAERQYKEAKDWVPDDCDDLYEEIEKSINEARSSSYDSYSENLYEE